MGQDPGGIPVFAQQGTGVQGQQQDPALVGLQTPRHGMQG